MVLKFISLTGAQETSSLLLLIVILDSVLLEESIQETKERYYYLYISMQRVVQLSIGCEGRHLQGKSVPTGCIIYMEIPYVLLTEPQSFRISFSCFRQCCLSTQNIPPNIANNTVGHSISQGVGVLIFPSFLFKE